MKFTTILMTVGFAAFAIAQSTATTTSAAPTRTPTAAERCVAGCNNEVACQANCLGNPNPDAAAVNATNQCVADCPQGTGTVADNDAYSLCRTGCISSHFLPTTTGNSPTPSPSAGGGESGSASPSGSPTTRSGSGSSADSGSSSSADSSNSPTGTGPSGSPSPSGTGAPNSANGILVSGSFAGLLALAAGVLAL